MEQLVVFQQPKGKTVLPHQQFRSGDQGLERSTCLRPRLGRRCL
jgi:hypothetical protein